VTLTRAEANAAAFRVVRTILDATDALAARRDDRGGLD